MGDGARATVTSLDALFSPEDTSKAVRRVEDAISERHSELGRLRGFVADNAALVSLVQKLPDELSHQIMVPFGSAAFFPGRLIHTNELLVLLGERYYAERTAKQTVEIFQRRGKALEAQVESLKATISDLEAEVKFFNSTAAEAAEGLVEIREEYVDEPPEWSSSYSQADNMGNQNQDEEYVRIMAKLDELEKEEREALSVSDNEEEASAPSVADEDDDSDEASFDLSSSRDFVKDQALGSDVHNDSNIGFGFAPSRDIFNDQRCKTQKGPSQELVGQQLLDSNSLRVQAANRQHNIDQAPIMYSKAQVPEKAVSFKAYDEILGSPEKPSGAKYSDSQLKVSSENTLSLAPKIIPGGRMAFTGSIVEHNDNLPPIQPPKGANREQPSSSNPSKPVSRFKMQKGGH